MNIKFIYLYRDAANYKNWNEIIFSNKQNLTSDEVRARIHSKLKDGEHFRAKKSGKPHKIVYKTSPMVVSSVLTRAG